MSTLAPALPFAPPPRFKVVRWAKSNPVFGPLREIQNDNLATFARMAKAGDAIEFRVLHQTLHLLTHPDHFRHVLVDRVKNYEKKTRGYMFMKQIVGNGLLTSEGSFWQRQRRLASPAFYKSRLPAFGDTMVRVAEETREQWKDGARIDVATEMMQATLRIVTLTLMSRDSLTDAAAVGAALGEALEHVTYRTKTPWAPPEWVPTSANRRFAKAKQTLDDVVNGIIAERRGAGPRAGSEDLLDILMGTRDEETGEGMTDAQLRDEILTIMLAGHETTAMTLTWTMHLLAQNPEIEAKLLAEIDGVLGSRAATFADLAALQYTDRVVHESLRLYPPAWIVARRAAEADEFDGVRIGAGDWVFLSPYVTQRRADFWPDPERFDPDRFAPERVASRNKYAWMPFIAGQRKCIGDQFALMEAKLILVTLLQRWRFKSAPGHVVKAEPLLTLRPANGMPMLLERRSVSVRPERGAAGAESKGQAAGRCPFGHG